MGKGSNIVWTMDRGFVEHDGRDYMFEQATEIEGVYATLAEVIDDPHWTTREGKRIRISEMTDQHLLNTISFLRRKAYEQYPELLSQAESMAAVMNGEQALIDISNAIFELEEGGWEALLDVVPQYDAMLESLHARKLEFPADDFLKTVKPADHDDWFWTG
jgi:hypothetical protein